jgi:LPXTG-motif cell wall-anchored protein
VTRAAACLAVMTCLTLTAGPAIASDDIGLSRDAVTWASELSDGLFDGAFTWVPGDSETESFYVRNQGPTDAVMVIEARSADSDDLLSNEDIKLRARVDGGTWADLENGAPTKSIRLHRIGKDDVVHVDVNATLNPTSTNQSQNKTLDLTLTVTLAETLQSGRGNSHHDVLPATGVQISNWLVILAGVMLTLGARLVLRGEVRDD